MTDLFNKLREAMAPAYRVERALGEGGMAIVYLAQDTKHDRPVAVKVLRAELGSDESRERFFREIRLAARLTHPNILPLLDSGDVGGSPYYVMPFVEGESIRARLDRDGTVPLPEALTFVAEVADALNYAHAAGFVHRDIKPENILLIGGHAAVADFGIARAIDASTASAGAAITSAGLIMGTPLYMSPEQATGDEHIDGRSDVYSLAVVLFEMLSGAAPFTGKTAQALISSRFTTVPPRLATRVADVPAYVDSAVAAALSLDAENRPATASAFAQLLLPQSGAFAAHAAVLPRTGASAALDARRRAASSTSNPTMPSVAVLPFANLSTDPENEFLSDGITEEIMGALSRLRTVRVAARSSSFAFKGRRENVQSIASQLGVATVLDGSVRRAGSRVRVAAQLVDAATGFEMWSDQFDRQLDDAFEIQSEIARAIAGALRATLLNAPPAPLALHAGAVSGAAYETYLRGRYALNKRTEAELHSAVGHFGEAVRQDPEFALAHAGMADALLLLGVYGAERPADVMPRARAAAERALAIDPSLPEAHATVGTVRSLFDWDWNGAADSFRRATTIGPRYSTAFQWNAVNHLLPLARTEEARAAIDRARSLDPLSMVIATSVGVVTHLSGDPAGAARVLQRALELDSSFVMTHYFMGGALRDAGDLAGSAAAFRTAIERSGGTPEMLAGFAQTLARQGDIAGARALQQDLVKAATRRRVSPALLAQVHTALGETNDALAALERALEDRDPELVFIGVRLAYAPLRGQERFEAIRRQVGV